MPPTKSYVMKNLHKNSTLPKKNFQPEGFPSIFGPTGGAICVVLEV